MEKITMNVRELTKAIAGTMEGKHSQKEVKTFLDTLEEVVKAQLAQANETASVEVKLMNGFSITSDFVAEHEARNPQDGSTVIAPAKRKVKAKISKVFKDAVNE